MMSSTAEVANNAHIDKLSNMLGFDPAKKVSITKDAFADVVKEIQEERMTEVKLRAKEQLVKAMQLREQMHKVDRDYQNQKKKFEKDLGKILNQITGALSGKSQEEIEEQEKEKTE